MPVEEELLAMRQKNPQFYMAEIKKRKIRILLAILAFLGLFMTSCHYLYDGINKRLLVYTFLCLCTSALILCPRPKSPYVSSFILLLYIIWVPRKMFQRMELPIHDMAKLKDGAMLANLFIIFLLYAILLLICQRICLSLGIGNMILLVLSIINYYVNHFQGGNLNFSNLLASGTALTVLDNYHLTMESELWYSILYFCFFIALGFWCDLPVKGWKYHCGVTAAALAYGLFFYGFWQSSYLQDHGMEGTYWSVQENEAQNGFLLGFGFSIRDLAIPQPSGYSDDAVARIIAETEAAYVNPHASAADQPNIIFIMNEAWSDLRVLGDIETSESFMPYVDSLTENCIKGNLFVEILGGITANSEFEALTGDTLAFLSPSSIPFQLEVNHDMYSVARVLKEQGYQTLAVHPNGKGSWYRDNVYNYFGFDKFVDINSFETTPEFLRVFVSDESNYDELIYHYEHRDKDAPFFLFNVTIQNHSDYYGGIDRPITLHKVGNTPPETEKYYYDAETYLNLMKITDEAFRQLIAYFEEVEEPTIVCMFGDHQPLLWDQFYNAIFEDRALTEQEQTALKYITPYIIWANYDIDFPEYGDMSSNYLGAALLECAGVELPPYYKYLLLLQKQYPEISRRTIEALAEEEPIKNYQILQYNQLKEQGMPNPLFSIAQ